MSQQIEEEKKYPAPVAAKFAGGALLAALPFDVLAHLGPTGLVVGGCLSYVAWRHGPEAYDMVRDTLPFLPALAGTPPEPGGEKVGVASKKPGRTFWQRAWGIYPDSRTMQDDPSLYVDPAEADTYDWYENEDDGPALPMMDSGMFTFSQLLASGFKPSLRKIFLGRLSDGTDIFVEAKDLCHVALAGNTGNGKSSLLRLIMAQLCAVRCRVLLLNPHYMVFDRDHNEDWTPYTPYLERDPMKCADVNTIANYLQWMVEKILAQRIIKARHGGSVGKPYFVVIDELPDIADARKDCIRYISKLLREGRKYGIFLIVASQDFLVKTTGMDGGAVRKCFRTACYVGGDLTTATALLEKQTDPIPETELGRGKMMLRCVATGKAVFAHAPYCDNEALYSLLGPSTYTPPMAQSMTDIDDIPVYEDEIDASLNELREWPDVDPDDSRYEELVAEPLPVIRKGGPRKATLSDAIEVWNDCGGTIGRPRLRKELQDRGLECSDDLALRLLANIKARLDEED